MSGQMRYYHDKDTYAVMQSANEYMAAHRFDQQCDFVEIYGQWQKETGHTAHCPDSAAILLEVMEAERNMDPSLLREMVEIDRSLRKEGL